MPQRQVEAPTRTATGQLPGRFTALGTEPFWAVEVDGTNLTYKTPEDEVGQRVTITRRSLQDGTELSGTLSGKVLILRSGPGPCSDGMSDTVYPHLAELRLGDERLSGCVKLP